jgi:hypothetical protein
MKGVRSQKRRRWDAPGGVEVTGMTLREVGEVVNGRCGRGTY